jgi:archaemetzincin
MHPTWTLTFSSGEPILCPFCRDKSEQRIRMAKT